MKALSIRQPWAGLIVAGYKDIENRNWPTSYRGSILIHAGKLPDNDCTDGVGYYCEFIDWLEEIGMGHVAHLLGGEINCSRRGGIVGIAEITDCVTESDSPWFTGKYGFVLRNARPLPFTPWKGQQSIFEIPDFEIRHLRVA